MLATADATGEDPEPVIRVRVSEPQLLRYYFFLGGFFKKSVETAVLDDGRLPGALVLTKRVE